MAPALGSTWLRDPNLGNLGLLTPRGAWARSWGKDNTRGLRTLITLILSQCPGSSHVPSLLLQPPTWALKLMFSLSTLSNIKQP